MASEVEVGGDGRRYRVHGMFAAGFPRAVSRMWQVTGGRAGADIWDLIWERREVAEDMRLGLRMEVVGEQAVLTLV